MNDQVIDITQVELYIEELRRNPEDRDERLDELVALYHFQLRLIRQWYEEN